MPLRGLRSNRSDRDLKRRSTLDPAGLFNRGEKNSEFHHSTEHLDRIAVSEDGGRPTSSDVPRQSMAPSIELAPPSPPIQEHTPNTRRFSVMRFRHASDSQLSVRAKEQAPPMPEMPAAPAIITTAPTVVEQEEPLPRKRGRFEQFSLRRRSFDPAATERPNLRTSMDKKTSTDIKRRPFGFMRSTTTLLEEPGRFSTSESPDALPEPAQEGKSSLSLPVPRFSDSSRSDGSSTGHVSFETPKARPAPRTGTSRFGLGRRNKQRASLFPLPMKISPPDPNTAPLTPRTSTNTKRSGSEDHSSAGQSTPPTGMHRASSNNDAGDGVRTPPMPSPSKIAMAAAGLNFAAPGSGRASGLLRNNSSKSVQSSRSSPNSRAPLRLGLRGRSSTMGSLGGRSDDGPPPTPPYATSGRNSISTVGRSSLSNLFGIGSRFRQQSEAHSPWHGSPAHGFVGTPGLSSHQNSLNISRETLVMPKREEGEAPGRYLERMEEIMDRGIIPSMLTKTDDVFLLAVLRSYMRKFAFFGDPIDMAIRKLLMHVELPKETQQIDRVLQGFADRYHECNPGIYINPDKAYFISFSIVILHTDFFNKNNKRKMQRADYIKNSSCEGVSDDVLGCIYDNVVYTPFIHFDEDLDTKVSRRNKKTSVFKAPMSDPARKATREPIDPYTLIFEGNLDALRPTIKDVMNLDDPYNYLGSASTLDTRALYNSFSKYGVIQIVSQRSRPEAFMSQANQENPMQTSMGIVEMPVTKVGVLWRKDTKRKAARSPWQEWGAVLTRSGLSLFRNPGWAKSLMQQHEQNLKHGHSGPIVFNPPVHEFKPDHLIPMDGAVALVDNSYKKHKNAFVLFSKIGEEVVLADNEKDLNDWLGLVNYSAAFETLGVRPRGLIGGLYEGQRHRGIRRLESSHSTNSIPTATGEVTITSGKIDNQLAQQMVAARRELMQQRIGESEERISQSIRELENRLRDARHLQILAPIQPKTREFVIHAAGRLAAKLKWARIEIWRMKCHRDILAQELEEEKNVVSERQARIDRINSATQASQLQPASPQTVKTSRLGSLARLSSRSSSTVTQKAPHSPSASVRPGTKSSVGTEPGEEVFKTPPESSQSSPNLPPGQIGFPPMSFSPQSSHRRPSATSLGAQSPRLIPRDHRPSVSTLSGRTISSDDGSDAGSRYKTPPPTGDAEVHKEEPKTPEVKAMDGLNVDHFSDSDMDQLPSTLAGSPESRSKVRRSLHRTLRDSHGGSSHRRGHKTRDSASTAVSDDTLESEGLSRAKGSFTLHGKKASVITFGAEWQNMPAEERLKVRKQAQEALQDGSSIDERDGGNEEKAQSIASASTATAPGALPGHGLDTEKTPRTSTEDNRKLRHASSQTVMPPVEENSANGHASDTAESIKEEEEEAVSPKGKVQQALGEGEDADANPAKLDVPNSQAVEA
ncbi:hypothetical protein GQ43DRAFT_259877 [Delitschia confertaspora ATCC 74209]|uniref:SEC7 domain-containing protein n=1 Tax=Delitschia confertaspora ATCC 74209 TaxID=1513339 RepID=A0A9P4JQF6_9PLEO|nr:hypothetical protein GQ43DRAFT_259877 [Delitschia confertaspora ATCC 74209]